MMSVLCVCHNKCGGRPCYHTCPQLPLSPGMLHMSLLSRAGGEGVKKSPRVWQDRIPGASPLEASHQAPSDSS